MQTIKEKNINFGLYIHWPFCIKKCPYCDFNSYAFEYEPENWVKALLLEMEHSKKEFPNYYLETIFFGGGTPSLIPPNYIKQLIECAYALWPDQKDNIEITLETNPSTVETHALEEFMQAGINRFSIGMQSLSDYNLQFLGRTHSAQEAIKILTHASKICDNVSADFIYTLPHETYLTWKDDLNLIIELANKLNLKHLSLYQLTIENNTAFEQQVSAKLWAPMNEDKQSVLYKHTYKTLLENGWDFYEISNACKITQNGRSSYKSKHNLLYWNYQPYLGIGPGAHSRMFNSQGEKIKFYNIKSPYKWLEAINNQNTYLSNKLDLETLTQHEEFQEKMLMGLRLTNGIDLTKQDIEFLNQHNFEKLLKHDFLKFDGKNIQATLKGRLCLNEVLKEICAI